jgi:hypothetical protein|nr:MAG TPA: hypothetical protein [Crassvirales sp.]
MADKYKTLPIGTIFTYNGNKYKVCDGITCSYTCVYCAFNNINCDKIKSIRGYCDSSSRTDSNQAYYKQINNETMKKDSGNIVCPIFNTNDSLNDLHVECPKGYSIDVEHSDLSKGIIKFKNNNIILGHIYENTTIEYATDNIIPNSTNHYYDKLLAIAELIDIANYYNKDWKPDFNNDKEDKYYICYSKRLEKYDINLSVICTDTFVYFKNKEDAQAVIDNPNFKDILDAIYKD